MLFDWMGRGFKQALRVAAQDRDILRHCSGKAGICIARIQFFLLASAV
jgi:hypothetical protein